MQGAGNVLEAPAWDGDAPGPGHGPEGPPSARAGSPTAAPAHLWQVDVVRLGAFTAVIAVHTLAFTVAPSNRLAAGAMMVLQFGREVFFALSAFVLVYAAGRRGALGRPRGPEPGDRPEGCDRRAFWSRRFAVVGVPYLAWSAIYYGYSVLGPRHAPATLPAFAHDLAWGGAEYHLYFLLVTMQLYLVFPWLLTFVRASAHCAGRVLVGVGALNVGWLAVVQWVPAPAGPAGWLWHRAYELLPTYGLCVLAGAYAAAHFASLHRFVGRHGRALAAAALVAVSGALLAYAVQLPGTRPRSAAAVLQPATLAASAAAVVVLYSLGTRWAEGRRRHQRGVAALSDASFGVYLAHPLVLQLMVDNRVAIGGQHVPAAAATIVAFVATGAGATAISLAARRTAVSLLLTGRPRQRRRQVAQTVPSQEVPRCK
ncbi:MAG: acyltransferase [Acidimicrobiales bacterium]